MTYELKHINGIPYYLNGTTVYTFELDAGKPSKCIAIGTYTDTNTDTNTNTITYYDDWATRVKDNLDSFRASLFAQERGKLRESIIKPQKQRKTIRTPKKTTRAKNTKDT